MLNASQEKWGAAMNEKLRSLLSREGVPFEVLPHREVYTAQERAAACHVSGRALAKVVVIHDPADGWYALAVLPAAAHLDLSGLRALTGRPGLRLARETEFARLFPDCDVGAMPPFGSLYGSLPVFLDRALAERAELVFEAGTHREEVRMPTREYLRLERPQVVSLALAASA